jgi:RND superfamily putative drug exporter
MLGLAVGIDYTLFVLARFRSELREGKSVFESVSRAVGTAGSAVVFAGATVVIALAGLSVVGIPFLTEMGLAAAFGLAAVPTVLAVSDAEAQTIGMERRQDRREGRHQRRDDRRTGRTDRREERRTGTAAGAVPAGTTTGSAK